LLLVTIAGPESLRLTRPATGTKVTLVRAGTADLTGSAVL